MRQFAVAAADVFGNFVCISEPSIGAKKGGVETSDHVRGKKFWDFVDAESATQIRESFLRCLIDQERQHFLNTSSINGHVEHWETTMMPCHGAEVIACSHEIIQPAGIELTSEDRVIISRLADDQTIDQIAAAMKVPSNTIASRLKRIRDRLTINTNHGLVAFCLRYGVL